MSNFFIVIIKINKNPNEPKRTQMNPNGFLHSQKTGIFVFFIAQKTTKKCLKLGEVKGNKEKKNQKKKLLKDSVIFNY